jgi:hypothetical protein
MQNLTEHLFTYVQFFWAALLLLAVVIVWIVVVVMGVYFVWGSLMLRPKSKVVLQPVAPLKK